MSADDRWAAWDEVCDALVLQGAAANELGALGTDTKRALIIHIFELQRSVHRLEQERDEWRAKAG